MQRVSSDIEPNSARWRRSVGRVNGKVITRRGEGYQVPRVAVVGRGSFRHLIDRNDPLHSRCRGESGKGAMPCRPVGNIPWRNADGGPVITNWDKDIPSGGIRVSDTIELLISLLQWGRQMGRDIITQFSRMITTYFIQSNFVVARRHIPGTLKIVSADLTDAEREWCRCSGNPYAVLNFISDEADGNSFDLRTHPNENRHGRFVSETSADQPLTAIPLTLTKS
jgi:hypothetical protein